MSQVSANLIEGDGRETKLTIDLMDLVGQSVIVSDYVGGWPMSMDKLRTKCSPNESDKLGNAASLHSLT